MNTDLLRSTWAALADHGVDEVTTWFYSVLFERHPEVRPLFPAHMAGQRRHLAQTIGLVVRSAGDLDTVVPRLRQLGDDHRRYGAAPGHYPAVRDALLATFGHFLGDDWTPAAAATWTEALDTIAGVMTAAADEATGPAVWDAEVVQVVQRDDSVCVEVDTGDPGCAAAGTVPVGLGRPGTWRLADMSSVAAGRRFLRITFDRDDPVTLEFAQLQPGDSIRLGAPRIVDPVDQGGPDGH